MVVTYNSTILGLGPNLGFEVVIAITGFFERGEGIATE